MHIIGFLHHLSEKNVSTTVLNVIKDQTNRNYLYPFWNINPGWILPEMVTVEASSKREAKVLRGPTAVVAQLSVPSPPLFLDLDPVFLQVH